MSPSDRRWSGAQTQSGNRPVASRWQMLAVTSLLLVACSSIVGRLDASLWRLSGWSLSSLQPDEFAISASFTAGRISGSSGVNRYSGPYSLGPGAAFSVGNITSTEMAGPEPAMRAERAYLTLLGEAKSYKSADGKLILYDKGGNESLIFAAASR